MLTDLICIKKRKGSCLELSGEVFEKMISLSKSVIIMLIFKYLLVFQLLESEVQYKISSFMFAFFLVAEP